MEQLQFGQMPAAQPSLRVLRETPAVRVTQSGAKNVALVELLGAVIGDPDVALRVLATYPSIEDLCRAPATDLGRIKGLGSNRVAAIQAAIELGRRAHLGGGVTRRQIRSPADAADLMMGDMSVLEQEELRVMLLNTRNHVLGVTTVYRGNVDSAIVRTGEVFREAIRRNASAVIIFHAHPSGDPEPSEADISTTQQIVQAGKLLDVQTVDHIIIGGGRYVSLRERGLDFE
jgi:DNA repair protein RadC